jgi:hypothetical protein
MFDLFQLFQLISAVKAGPTVFVCWAKAMASLPSAQAFNGDARKRGNAANAIKIVWYVICHRFCTGTKGRQEYGYISVCPDRVFGCFGRCSASETVVFTPCCDCGFPRSLSASIMRRSVTEQDWE